MNKNNAITYHILLKNEDIKTTNLRLNNHKGKYAFAIFKQMESFEDFKGFKSEDLKEPELIFSSPTILFSDDDKNISSQLCATHALNLLYEILSEEKKINSNSSFDIKIYSSGYDYSTLNTLNRWINLDLNKGNYNKHKTLPSFLPIFSLFKIKEDFSIKNFSFIGLWDNVVNIVDGSCKPPYDIIDQDFFLVFLHNFLNKIDLGDFNFQTTDFLEKNFLKKKLQECVSTNSLLEPELKKDKHGNIFSINKKQIKINGSEIDSNLLNKLDELLSKKKEIENEIALIKSQVLNKSLKASF